jgi:hypothetical protein
MLPLGRGKGQPFAIVTHRKHTHEPRTSLAKPLVLRNASAYTAHPPAIAMADVHHVATLFQPPRAGKPKIRGLGEDFKHH